MIEFRLRRAATGAVLMLMLPLVVSCSTTEASPGSNTLVAAEAAGSGQSGIDSDAAAAAVTAVAGETGAASTLPVDGVPTTDASTVPPVTVIPLSGWAAVDQYLEVTLIRGGSSAASVAVLRNGELQHQAAYGQRIPGEQAEPTDRFRIASISKTVLAITALELVEDGVLSIDAPVGAQLAGGLGIGSPASGTESITLRQLLTHRSGFPQYENLFFRNEVGSCTEAARTGLSRSLQSVPGTRFQYSNMNFCVLGLLIEQATGLPYQQVVQEQVLTPLGITSMRTAGTFDVGPDDVEHESKAGRNYMESLGGAGAWLATPTDLVRVLDSLDPSTPGTKILEPASLSLMATITETPPEPADDVVAVEPTLAPTTTLVPLPPTSGYGMGLMIFDQPLNTDQGAATIGHTGTLESTHAMFVRRPDGLTWALIVSGDYPSSTRELATIMDNALLLGGFADGSYTTPSPPLGVD